MCVVASANVSGLASTLIDVAEVDTASATLALMLIAFTMIALANSTVLK
jgi:hypothetical protein